MAKLTLSNVVSGFASTTTTNANNDLIETALENTLSRDGTSPNTMNADIDMNGYRLLNELATSGDGFIWKGQWVTATAYVVNNLVIEAGTTYICKVAHTSGTFSTDLTAVKWEILASKGSAGAGTGDMLAANNLSELTATAATARSNIVAAKSGANSDITSLAGVTSTGDIILSGNAAIEEARANIAMHATTMNLWAGPNVLDGTGTAATLTAIANAPQAGARRTLLPIVGSIITHGATFSVEGAASRTAAAGERWEFEAITASTYNVYVTKKDGTAVAGGSFASTAETQTGTETAKSVTPAGLKGAVGFSKLFTSSEIACTFSANSVVSAAHGLGGIPILFQAFLICKTAEHGFSIGDIVACTTGSTANGTPPLNSWADATNVGLAHTAVMSFSNKSTGAGTGAMTDANWKWFFRAWL